jgi:hypothetical protein
MDDSDALFDVAGLTSIFHEAPVLCRGGVGAVVFG